MSNETTDTSSAVKKMGAGVHMLQVELERHVPSGVQETINSVVDSVPRLRGLPVMAFTVIVAVIGSASITSVAFASAMLGGDPEVSISEGVGPVDIESLSGREKLAAVIAGEQNDMPQVFSGRLRIRYKGRVIATLEPSGQFRGGKGSGRITAEGKIKLRGKPLGKVGSNSRVKDQKGRRAGRLEDDGTLRNGKGKKIGMIEADGTIRVRSAKVGVVDGAGAHDLRLIAAYLLLVDPIERR